MTSRKSSKPTTPLNFVTDFYDQVCISYKSGNEELISVGTIGVNASKLLQEAEISAFFRARLALRVV